jgi:5'-nucleotidase
MSKKRRILITNDDGYYSDGIAALYKELSRKHDVYMVAPDREQSASSHSLTLKRPLRVYKIDRRRFAIDGTPTDCVMLAIHLIFKKRRPDMIVSGINHGSNMGDDVTYSGTVAAAIEGAILGIPSIAISMANYEPDTPMIRGAKFAVRFVDRFDKFALSPSVFLNINLPLDNGRPYHKYQFTSQGYRHYKDTVVSKVDPRGEPYYWIGGRPMWRSTPGTDFAAVKAGKISITPMKLAFTDTEALPELEKLNLKF